ncbi:MAG: TIGR03663 family protein [Anaerolineales bacterium]|jgi:uncharacterized protein (TIGR03663 family)
MQTTQAISHQGKTSWLDRPLFSVVSLNLETILFVSILLVAVVSRFYHLDVRVMSHDETSHVYWSWRLYRGEGYQHDPVTHGPLQFHLIALSYFLFGDSDFTARIPMALASIATIVFMWNYRRYLGRAGALVAAFLFLISPYMLYYGRYARNEAFVALFGVMTLWAILRYLESGEHRYLYWLTAATVLHFTAKETAFIYTAQALLFLAFFFIIRVFRAPWPRPENRTRFLFALVVAVLLLVGAGAYGLLELNQPAVSATETAQPAVPGQELPASTPVNAISPSMLLAGVAFLTLLVAAYFLVRGYTLPFIRTERSFDLLILLGTMVLPMLAPFPVKFLGWNPTDYTYQGMIRTALFLVPLAVVAVGLGLWWNPRLWLANAALFYGIFTLFYTTFFTNGNGFFTGLVGSLGYWLEQQGVHRGEQPWYYYILIQVPFYEYLPALGSLLAVYWGLRSESREKSSVPAEQPVGQMEFEPGGNPGDESESQSLSGSGLAVTLFGYWAITSILAYTYAGEKMPWLTVHIALPLILLSGWAIGRLIDSIDWSAFRSRRGLVVVALLPVFLLSLIAALGSYLGTNPPFQGKELNQLQATSTFMTSLLAAIASGWGLAYLLKSWSSGQTRRVMTLTFFGLVSLLTIRTAYTAAYINYNNAKEYLVYAHSGPGAKEIMQQVNDLSRRTTDGLAMAVAYDDITTYPFWWYLRNYSNQRFYGANPTRDLREVPIILVGSENYGKIEPVVGQAYYQFDYVRMWWPDQGYFNLSFDRIWNAIANPEWRRAIFQIWFNRDYSLYGDLNGSDMSLPNWSPADRMRMYVRKDIAAKIWNLGVGPSAEEVVADPYQGKEAQLNADIVLGETGAAPGQFMRPRGLAVAPDGSIYVADTENNRIQHIDRDGNVLQVWGSFADITQGEAPGGTFNQPWGIALDPDGSVYVADIWNSRIQKFTPDGKFILMWGYFGQGETPTAFWGPRDVVVDSLGHVLVSDTGNKRIVIFDADGNFISQFGSEGFSPGQFSEPVGLAIDGQGRLYVADTWNQRIQVFTPDSGGNYTALTSWDIYGWFGQSVDNKPYLAADDQGHVFATDPEAYRVLEFTSQGDIVRYWGDYGLGTDSFGLAGAVAVDPLGGVWVSDTKNGRLMHFTLPPEP